MKVKICGVTDPKTAACGAAYIGLVFARKSPRRVTLVQAAMIAAAARNAGAEPVAVFDEQSAEEIISIASVLELKIVQLHGDNARAAYDALPEELVRIYAGNRPETFNAARDFLLFDGVEPGSGKECDRSDFAAPSCRFFLAGGLKPETVQAVIARLSPYGVDVSSGVEERLGVKSAEKIEAFLQAAKTGRFGAFGGSYVPELLVQPLADLARAYREIGPAFRAELKAILRNYAGRPTPITEVANFAKAIGGPRIFLKREDLLHTGAHKLNNAIGQCLLAKKCGKTRIIAETGAGQHGVATATACALFGLECVIYMGAVDVERQAPNVAKIRLLGAKVVAVPTGSATLKDAVNEALRDWAESYESSHYCLGSALGPHPFPSMVADFQSIIGEEAREQFQALAGQHPDLAVACVGGGSNAIGLFSAYLNDPEVALVGVEAGGEGKGRNAARFAEGSPGTLHGSYSYVLQNEEGQIADTHSISAGLDYPGVGPQHSALFESGRVRYDAALDHEALEAFQLLCRSEGIIPALESSHALAYVVRVAKTLKKEACILINLSGRGDKDLPQLFAKGLIQ